MFISCRALGRRALFRPEKFYSGIYCTDEVRSFIISKKLTNIDFLEFGDIL